MNALLLAAAIVSAVTLGIHLFLGGPTVARPILAARDLEDTPKYTSYYCWHCTSLVLLAMSVSFALAAQRPQSRELAILMTALAGAFTVWNVALVVWKYHRPLELPQWTLFVPIAVLGGLGVW